MKRIIFLALLVSGAKPLMAQYVYTINADSVKITNHCDTAEFILENHTQTVPGFLFNKGRGRTEFRRALLALNDSLYLLGSDTLNIRKGLSGLVQAANGLSMSGSQVVFGNNTSDTIAKLLSNRELPLNSKSINFSDAASGGKIVLSGGNVTISRSVTNNTGFGGLFSVSGTLDFLNSNPGNTLSTGNVNSGMKFKPHGTEPTANIINNSVAINDVFTPTGAGNFGYTALIIQPSLQFGTYGSNTLSDFLNDNRTVRGLYYNGQVSGTLPARHLAIETTNGDVIFNTGGVFNSIANKGHAGFQGITTPTAFIEIGASTGVASSAPLKFNAGTDLSTPETGAMEYDGNRLAFTAANTRKRIVVANDITPANGQIPIGNGTDFTGNTLTAGAGVAITNGSGTVSIAARATVSVSPASTLTLSASATDYIFSGTTATWTLPAVAGNTGLRFFIKNRGTGTLTLNSSAGGNDLYTTSPVSTLVLNPGDAYFLVNDGTYYSVK